VAVQNAVAYEKRAGLIRSLWPAAGLEVISYEAWRDKRVYVRRITS
jgi:hypothetical protein